MHLFNFLVFVEGLVKDAWRQSGPDAEQLGI